VRATLGVEGRVVVLALLGGFTARPAVPMLVGAVLLLLVYAAESARAWRAVGRGTRQDGSS
jgi:hypothetical protein